MKIVFLEDKLFTRSNYFSFFLFFRSFPKKNLHEYICCKHLLLYLMVCISWQVCLFENQSKIIFQHQNTQLRNASQYTREKLSDRQANREEVTTFLTNRFRVKYFKLFYDLLTFYNEHIKWSLFQCIQKLHILQLNYKIAQHTYIFMSKNFSWNIYQ